MSSPTIVYLHGFNSAPQSVKGQLVARAAAAMANPPRFYRPELHHRPARAIRDVCAWIDREAPGGRGLALIGSSLGGYYATYLAERYDARAIVINPAIVPCENLRAYVGRQRNPYTGVEYDLGPEHFDELAALKIDQIARPDRYFLLARSGDELLGWRDAARFYAGAFQYIAGGGDHGWTDFGDEVASVLRFALHGLPSALRAAGQFALGSGPAG